MTSLTFYKDEKGTYRVGFKLFLDCHHDGEVEDIEVDYRSTTNLEQLKLYRDELDRFIKQEEE